MNHYYIQTSAGQEGPFTIDELRQKNIHARTPVWNEVLHNWTPAGEIEALKPILKTVTPPPFHPPSPSDTLKPDQAPKERFRLNLFHWLGIGAVLLMALIYFLYPGEGSSNKTDEVARMEAREGDSTQKLRQKRLSAQLAAKNRNYRNNWNSYIKAVPGRYKKGFFGGISNLEPIIRNKTEYPLDVVIIVVRYVKDNGEIYKSKYLPVYNVPANGESSVRAPDSSRGTRVRIEIIQISSRQMNFLYSNDMDVKGKDDPYYQGSKE